jgi:cytochrome c oxidase subunit IV
MSESTHAAAHSGGHEHGSLSTKLIWKVFWILLAVTIFEVAISFTGISKEVLMYTFIVLTIVKSYYIVGYFMHLKYEAVPFQWSILLPFLLIVYLIFIALYEGSSLTMAPL